VWGKSLKPTFENFLTPSLKIWQEKTQISPTRRQSEAHNFETAQRIDKQKLYLSSAINALKMVPNLGHYPTEF